MRQWKYWLLILRVDGDMIGCEPWCRVYSKTTLANRRSAGWFTLVFVFSFAHWVITVLWSVPTQGLYAPVSIIHNMWVFLFNVLEDWARVTRIHTSLSQLVHSSLVIGLICHVKQKRRDLCNINKERSVNKVLPKPPCRFLDFYISQNPSVASESTPPSSKCGEGSEVLVIEEKMQDPVWYLTRSMLTGALRTYAYFRRYPQSLLFQPPIFDSLSLSHKSGEQFIESEMAAFTDISFKFLLHHSLTHLSLYPCTEMWKSHVISIYHTNAHIERIS